MSIRVCLYLSLPTLCHNQLHLTLLLSSLAEMRFLSFSLHMLLVVSLSHPLMAKLLMQQCIVFLATPAQIRLPRGPSALPSFVALRMLLLLYLPKISSYLCAGYLSFSCIFPPPTLSVTAVPRAYRMGYFKELRLAALQDLSPALQVRLLEEAVATPPTTPTRHRNIQASARHDLATLNALPETPPLDPAMETSAPSPLD
jgi:hypothetical protein